MEVFLRTKHLSRRLLLFLYSCLSFIFFCAFYQYSVSHSGLDKPLASPDLKSGRPVPTMVRSDWTLQHSNSTNVVNHRSVADVGELQVEVGKRPLSLQVNGSYSVNRHVHFGSFEVKHSFLDSAKIKPRFLVKTTAYATSSPVAPRQRNSVHYYDIVPDTQTESDDRNSTFSDPSCTSTNTSKSKLILLWTPFFGSWNYLPSGPFTHCTSSCTNCLVTSDRSRLLESDAVIFHVRDMFLADLPLKRLPNQRWIFYCLESPPYSDFPGLQFMNRMFNWTMTYRSDSDIVTQYGTVQKVYPRRKLDRANLQAAWEMKRKSVVWMSSHCPTHGGRDAFVAELKKYIDVDEYGTCGTMDCPKDSTNQCLRQFADNYKFFLAFENTICTDYITEKFFRTLKYDIVPVVFGGARYEKFAPPGSYVDALGFKSPKHLAFFLTGVGKDFSLYSSYFEWRKEFAVRMDSNKECALCGLLHKEDSKPSVYQDMRNWWVHSGRCRTWKPKSVRP